MILYKNRLIFGIIKTIFSAVFGVVNKILSIFNLQPTALLLLIGVVLYFTGVFDQSPALLVIFELLVIISVVYAVIATIKRLLGLDKKVKRSKGAQIVSQDDKIEKVEEQPVIHVTTGGTSSAIEQVVALEKPVYFRVKQNPEYVMAEYKDRYELFKIVNGSLKKIRVDYKNGEHA